MWIWTYRSLFPFVLFWCDCLPLISGQFARTTTFKPDAIPENIYRWIEENAYLCSNVPGVGGTMINFLTEEEGLQCTLCPEIHPKQIPKMACGIESNGIGQEVNVGCHQIPELCLLEFKSRYADFFFPETGEVPKEEFPNEIFEATINPFLDNAHGFDFDKMFGPPPDTTTSAPRTTTTRTPPPFMRIRTTRFPFTKQNRPTTTAGQEFEDRNSFQEFFTPANNWQSLNQVDGETDKLAFPTLRPRLEPHEEELPFDHHEAFRNNEVQPEFPAHPNPLQHRPHPPPFVAETFHPTPIHVPSSAFNHDNKIQKRIKTNQHPAMECRDTHRLCCYWAMAGECDANPFWMRVKCAKTCGTCSCSQADQCISTGINCTIPTTTTSTSTTTTTTPAPTTTTTTPKPTTRARITPPPTTRPRQPITNRWYPWQNPTTKKSYPGPPSRKPTENELESLYYTSPPPTTTTTTTTPAPTTTTPQETCFNYHQLCQFWSELGECLTNPFWMRPHCQKACKSCGERLEDIYAPEPRPGCLNTHILCPFWAFIGECGTNPRWMLLHCRLSCQIC